MQILKSLCFYLIFTLSFIAFAQPIYLSTEPKKLNPQEIAKLCNKFAKLKSEHNKCLTKWATLNVSIINQEDMIRTCDGSKAEIHKCLDIKAKHSQQILTKTEEQMSNLLFKEFDEMYIYVWEA